MKTSKTLSNSLIFLLSFLSSLFFIQPKAAQAEESPLCPDPTTTTITSINGTDDDTSFFSLTGGNGFCRSTPDTYGVTVYKMGFCKKNPGNPTGLDPLEGEEPNYSSCTWSFESTSGTVADFSAGGSIDLTEANSSEPAYGTYPHAVMLISNTFRIKGKYGPVAGLTYYTTDTFDEPSTEISNFDVTDAPLDSFSGPTQCGAYTENETVEGGTISGYLLGSSGAILTSTAENSGSPCVGMVKILAVMNMSEDLTISDATKGLKVTFIVSDRAMSVMSNDNSTAIKHDSGPFSATFETF